MSGECLCVWSLIRNEFDKNVARDNCIGPSQVRILLKALRHPYPVDAVDVENCLLSVAEGAEESDSKARIKPVPFEKWYKKYFDEVEIDEN